MSKAGGKSKGLIEDNRQETQEYMRQMAAIMEVPDIRARQERLKKREYFWEDIRKETLLGDIDALLLAFDAIQAEHNAVMAEKVAADRENARLLRTTR
ncbi:MAG: hypothetical protein V2B18_00795 [Pseudomonadota bacterium]